MSDDVHELRLYDRSRVTTDWSCRRKRYLGYEYKGKGLTSGHSPLELYLGTVVHDGLAAIAGGVDIDVVATTQQDHMFRSLMEQSAGEDEVQALGFAREQGALVEGLLRGFKKATWDQLTSGRKIVAVEQEMTYPHDGLVFMSKPDLVLEDEEGNLIYVEYKTTSTKKESWVSSWGTAVQLHSTIKAIEHTLDRHVTGVIVQGLYKGYESYGKQSSPFCYGYHRTGHAPFTTSDTIYSYKSGYKRVATWEMDGAVKGWVEGMPDDVLSDQFPQSPMIYVKDDLVERFFAQCATREKEIDMALGMMKFAEGDEEAQRAILDVSFPQTFSECQPPWGKGCQFRSICHGRGGDPLTQGYVYRVPHHVPEMEAWVEREKKEWDRLEAEVRPGERLKEAIFGVG